MANIDLRTEIAPPHAAAAADVGLGALLSELIATTDLYGLSAAEALTTLLTFGGRLPLEHGLEALGAFDEAVFQLIQNQSHVRLVPASHESGDELICDVYVNSLGRFHIRDHREPRPAYHRLVTAQQIGSLHLDPHTASAAFERAAAADQHELAQRRRVDRWLFDVDRTCGRDDLVAAVDDAVRHVEAVCFYVDDELFCNMEGLATLVDKGNDTGTLTVLRDRPIVEWTPAQRLAIAALRLLFLSGRSIRFEELNGKTLTAVRLMALFDRLTASYAPIGCVQERNDIGQWASAIGRLALDSPGKRLLRYRWISGVTYFKTERVTDAPTSEDVDAQIPEWALQWSEERVGMHAACGWRALFEALADDAIARTLDGERADPALAPATTPVEALIQQIVWSAAERTHAHYSMSSAIREPARLIVADEDQRRGAMAALKPADFYCCIAGQPALRATFGDRVASHVYRGVQTRMQFNRWHFIAGNYSRVPGHRHYFYPPTMPDLAEWSDLRHAGHARAAVRYSVRCPGPDMHDPPLAIGGHPYRGFYDIRVVRIEGAPFTIADMLVARCHLLWMGAVWARIVNAIEREHAPLRIVGFPAGEGYEGRSAL